MGPWLHDNFFCAPIQFSQIHVCGVAVVNILGQTFDTGLGVDALALCFELGDGGIKHHGASVGIFAPLQSLRDFYFDALDETGFSLRQLEDGAFAAAANGCTRCYVWIGSHSVTLSGKISKPLIRREIEFFRKFQGHHRFCHIKNHHKRPSNPIPTATVFLLGTWQH